MVHLVTGYAGYEHITSADQGSFNAAFFGRGQFVMEAGDQIKASIIDNNTVRVLDGDILMHGRHIRILPDNYEDITITTGMAGKNRIDVICMTYEKNTLDGTEKAYIEVVKGAETEGIPAMPKCISGNILDGAEKNQMPLYNVTISGVVLSDIACLFRTIPTYKTLAEKYEQEFIQACENHLGALGVIDTMDGINNNNKGDQLAGALALKEFVLNVNEALKGKSDTNHTHVYTSLNMLGITSTYIPDIIAKMPKNTTFMTLINSTGIYDNAANKLSELKISSGVLTIDKAESYVRVIVTTNNSVGSNGSLYIGSIDTNAKKVNKWYEIDAAKIDELSTALAGKAASSHTHDDRYYTETEVDNLLKGKAASSHTHDDRYYTETEVDNLLKGKAASSHTHDAKKITLNDIDIYFKYLGDGNSEMDQYANVEEYLKSISSSLMSLATNKLPKSGGTVTGNLGVSGDVSLTAGKKLRIGDVAYLTSIASNRSEWTFGNGIGVHITNGDNSWRALRPNTDNNMTLGTTNERWQNVFAGSSAISTSDRNLKKDITPISDKYLKFFALLQPVTYRFKDGTSNRIHVGFISQDVEAAMAQVGFTDLDFAGFCRDKMQREVKTMHQQPVFDGNGDPLLDDDGKPIMSEWYDISYEDVLDDDGKPVYIYSLRYEEFIAINTAVIQRQQAKITGLEQRLERLEKQCLQ